MATIGTFTPAPNGGFTGAVKTLTLNVKVRIVPVAGKKDKGPDFRLLGPNDIELGAGWTKAAKESGRTYHAFRIDDPSFPQPVFANLIDAGTEPGKPATHALIWSRPATKRSPRKNRAAS